MRIRRFWAKILGLFKHKKEPFIYVALGDSTVEGVGATSPERSFAPIISMFLKRYKGNVAFYNLGKSGSAVRDVLENQVKKAIELKPNLVTISVGSNDILQRRFQNHFGKDLHAVLAKLRTQTNAEIVMNNIPDFSITSAVPSYLKMISGYIVKKMNLIIQKAAEKYQVVLVDLYFYSSIYGTTYPEAVSDDNFHPSDFGYALWANTIISHIRHIIIPGKYSSVSL